MVEWHGFWWTLTGTVALIQLERSYILPVWNRQLLFSKKSDPLFAQILFNLDYLLNKKGIIAGLLTKLECLQPSQCSSEVYPGRELRKGGWFGGCDEGQSHLRRPQHEKGGLQRYRRTSSRADGKHPTYFGHEQRDTLIKVLLWPARQHRAHGVNNWQVPMFSYSLRFWDKKFKNFPWYVWSKIWNGPSSTL